MSQSLQKIFQAIALYFVVDGLHRVKEHIGKKNFLPQLNSSNNNPYNFTYCITIKSLLLELYYKNINSNNADRKDCYLPHLRNNIKFY